MHSDSRGLSSQKLILLREVYMRILILTNTYYQVLFAMQLKLVRYKNCEVDLIISDHSTNSDVVSSKLAQENFFCNVFFVKSKGLVLNRNKFEKLEDFFKIAFCKDNRYKFFVPNIENCFYDEFLVFNYDIQSYGIFSYLCNTNPNIKISRFEEGLFSNSVELMQTSRRKIISDFRKIQKKPIIEKAWHNYYSFTPHLYTGLLNPVLIPPINFNNEVLDILKKSFCINKDSLNYKQKYIFFTSVYDFEGGEPIGEYELVCKIANLIGKENLLVKTHPRDERTIYKDNGFNVDKNSYMPWEVVQLINDFSDKIFLTATSGSVLAGSFMSENPPKTFFMHKCCTVLGNPVAKKTIETIEKLLLDKNLTNSLKNVDIANDIKDILI